MADIIDSYNCIMIKSDKNSNSTSEIENEKEEESSEQCDDIQNGKPINSDEHSLSSSSNPYKDFSGIDTESFITTTLRNNPKDRTLLLTLEKVFQDFIQNQDQTSHQFQAMNSCRDLFSIS